jgi:hypothetical protein
MIKYFIYKKCFECGLSFQPTKHRKYVCFCTNECFEKHVKKINVDIVKKEGLP